MEWPLFGHKKALRANVDQGYPSLLSLVEHYNVMASIKEIKDSSADEMEVANLEKQAESLEHIPSPQAKLIPLTIGLCLAVFLLSVDRTIVAVVRKTPSQARRRRY